MDGEMEMEGMMFEGGADDSALAEGCGICLEPVAQRGEIEGCSHLYCFGCIEKWAESQQPTRAKPATCPMCKVGFTQLLKHEPIDPLDLVLGDDEEDAERHRPAPTVVPIGPQPRGRSRRTRRQVQPHAEVAAAAAAAEVLEDNILTGEAADTALASFDLTEEVPPARPARGAARRTRRGAAAAGSGRSGTRSRRQAARSMRREQEDLGIDDDQALAMALAASQADGGTRQAEPMAAARPEPAEPEPAEEEPEEPEEVVEPVAAPSRASAREARGTAAKRAPRANRSRRRIIVDPISGQRIRGRRFQSADDSPPAPRPAQPEPEQPEPPPEPEAAGSPQPCESPEPSVDGEQQAREQMVAERLGRNLAAVVAPSPLRFGLGNAPAPADSQPTDDAPASPEADPEESSDSLSLSFLNDDGSENDNGGEAADASGRGSSVGVSGVSLDESSGDLMSRLQKRFKGPPLGERHPNVAA